MSGSGKERDLRIPADVLASAGLDRQTMELLAQLSRRAEENRRERQAQGIAAAKARGVRLGRPAAEMPGNFGHIVAGWESRRIPIETALRLCGVSRATFFRWLKRYRDSGEGQG